MPKCDFFLKKRTKEIVVYVLEFMLTFDDMQNTCPFISPLGEALKLLKIKKPVFCFDGSDRLRIKCLTRDGNQTYPN